MALLTKAPRGTQDLLPSKAHRFQYIEKVVAETAACFGFYEIRTPVFEHTELFNRSVGDTTDVVQKEMYTFEDNGKRSISLRPEGTAGAVRAFLEHGLFNEPLPQKLWYLTSCYRYEKPQAGRLREFHQFGVEAFGSRSAAQDAEVMAIARHVFDRIGVANITLEINSIGCPVCRKEYHKALLAYFNEKKGDLCETCLGRLERNPMRILDCKSPICSAIAADAPVITDFLCDECTDHFAQVQKYLNAMDIEFIINPHIVRGLDYYTKTVFEFITHDLGAQSAVCAGGRYDGLVEQLGGNPLPACGFGMGVERLDLLMQAQNIEVPEPEHCSLYVAPYNEEFSFEAMRLVNDLRAEGVYALTDVTGRSVKAQMKYADKCKADYTMILGADDIANRTARVKRMSDGTVSEIGLDDFCDDFIRLTINDALSDFAGEEFTL